MQKAHPQELEKSGHTVVHTDFYMSGVGSAKCGPELMPKYRLDEGDIDFYLTLCPISADKDCFEQYHAAQTIPSHLTYAVNRVKKQSDEAANVYDREKVRRSIQEEEFI